MSGVDLRYVASSGRSYNLRSDTLKTRSSANFHDWKWDVIASQLQIGERVTAFSKKPAVYDVELMLIGTSEEKLAQLDRLHEDFELDLRSVKPGRLIWNDYHIECYATESSTKPNSSNMIVDNTVTFYCPYPFWIKEEKRSFYPQAVNADEEFLDYPHDYPYDFYSGEAGSATWQTDFPFKSDFKMVIYGPATNPRIVINDHVYQILDDLGETEYVIIDSKLATIEKVTASGHKINAFDLRNKESSVFEQLPAETLYLSWLGTFGFDLTLYEERSEPR